MFSYEKSNGKFQEFRINIGEQWSKQDIKSQELNTIFNLIDDGDGILSEQEYSIFDRLLQMADGSDGGNSNKTAEISELKTLIEKIKNKYIIPEDLNSKPEEYYDEDKYSVEALKKRYPETQYEFVFPMTTQLSIIDKKTGKTVMELFYTNDSEINGVYTITEYDKEGNELFRVYNSDKKLESYIGKDGVRHEILPENIYAEITQKKLGFISTTGKNLGKYLNELNKNNIEEMLAKYESVSGNSLISDIFTERGLDSELRAKYVKQIIDTWLDARETKYIKKINNFRDAFYKLIQQEKDGFAPMSAKKIELLMKQIKDVQQVDITIVRPEEDEIARKADGKIDANFSQGSTGDCWLLAAIKSIVNNPVAKQILENQISSDKNGNITINLKFVNKKYTFKKDEIEKRYDLSDGDMDLRALEMAVEKYFKEESWAFEFTSLFRDEGALDGNNPNRAYEVLLGKGGGIFNRHVISNKFITQGFVDDIKEGKFLATVFSMKFLNDESDFTVKDNKGIEHSLHRDHAYAVLSADDNYVYLVNPWDSSSTLIVPTDKFISFFDAAGIIDTDDINKQFFGENAVINKDGKVFIPSSAKGMLAKSAEGYGKSYVSEEELSKIKEDAEQKYGKNYNISVNKNGDILLIPKENNKA